MGLTVVAPPALAAGMPKPLPKTSLRTAAATKVAANLNTAAAIAPAPDSAGGSTSESKPFFKSGKGIAALVLMIGASAWVLQSRLSGSDVVHSPGKN
jgi:hypothetical protein